MVTLNQQCNCNTQYWIMLFTTIILTHWGRMTHIWVGKLTIKLSDNGLSPGRRQANIRTNAGILLIGTLGTNFSEILSEIHTFSFKKMHLKMSSGRWRPFCLGLNGLKKPYSIPKLLLHPWRHQVNSLDTDWMTRGSSYILCDGVLTHRPQCRLIMNFGISSANRQPLCLDLNVLPIVSV